MGELFSANSYDAELDNISAEDELDGEPIDSLDEAPESWPTENDSTAPLPTPTPTEVEEQVCYGMVSSHTSQNTPKNLFLLL